MSKPINLLGYKNISAGKLLKRFDASIKSLKNRVELHRKKSRYWESRFRRAAEGRTHFKKKSSQLAKKLKDLEKLNAILEQELLSLQEQKAKEVGLLNTSPVLEGSRYPSWQIGFSIDYYLHSSSSFRSIDKAWFHLSKYLNISKLPSHDVIRHWVLRVGLYKLQQPVEKADDWVYIIDYSIQMSTEYCLVILGFRLAQWRNYQSQALSIDQVQVLDLIVTEHPKGEQVKQRLDATMARTGIPCQILADRGGNIRKGQRLWLESLAAVAKVIFTYDLSHLIGCLLKSFLEKNEDWKTLVAQMNTIQKRNQQSYAGFLAPPSLRKTARYMNIYGYVNYLERLLAYEQRGDFSLLARNWTCTPVNSTKECVDGVDIICPIAPLKADTSKALIEELEYLELPIEAQTLEHDGQTEFENRFGGLAICNTFILQLITLVSWLKKLQKDLKTKGLSKKRVERWCKYQPPLPSCMLTQFWNPLMDKLKEAVQHLPEDQIFLVTSDIIESLFGHYKSKVSKYWLKGMSPLVLFMPALAGQLDQHTIEQALQEVKIQDVQNWFASQRQTDSFLTKRKQSLKKVEKSPKKIKQPVEVIKTLPKTQEQEVRVA